ncbi:MAG: sulfotransferase [Gemmatimonadota bacterium]
MPKNVVVVGMPRTGTSLVAGIFGRKGYFTADDPTAALRTGDQHNPGGYWEAETLTRMNAEVFAAAGYAEDTSWLGAPMSSEAAARIGELAPVQAHRELIATYEAHAPWLWKDPRLCYTLEYWWPLLPTEGTRVLLTRRDPEAIWQSFVRLHWREPTPEARADVMERIERHLGAAKDAITRLAIPHLEVRYEDFAADPVSMAAALSDFLDVELGAEDLSFSTKLDHSRLRGRIATYVEHRYERLPPGLRRAAKRLVPRTLLRALFPERRTLK